MQELVDGFSLVSCVLAEPLLPARMKARITALKPAASASTNPPQKAIDAGVISWNGQNPVIPPPVKLNDGGPLMSDIVIEDRG
jgi:hypothetical protein